MLWTSGWTTTFHVLISTSDMRSYTNLSSFAGTSWLPFTLPTAAESHSAKLELSKFSTLHFEKLCFRRWWSSSQGLVFARVSIPLNTDGQNHLSWQTKLYIFFVGAYKSHVLNWFQPYRLRVSVCKIASQTFKTHTVCLWSAPWRLPLTAGFGEAARVYDDAGNWTRALPETYR